MILIRMHTAFFNFLKKNHMPKRHIGVSIDGIRNQMAGDFNNLVRTLHAKISYDRSYIDITADDIQESMDGLRQAIGALHCIYMEDTEYFSDLSDNLDKILWFNPEPED